MSGFDHPGCFKMLRVSMRRLIILPVIGLLSATAAEIGSAEAGIDSQIGKPTPLFGFDTPSEVDEWGILTDVVMGGKSWANLALAEPGIARFSGEISLADQSAGFAQTRSPEVEDPSADVAGWQVRVRGDGKSYMISVNTSDSHRGVYYRAEFSTQEGKWETIDFALEDFKPHFRGFWVAHGGIDPANVVSIGFMIAGRQEGPFSLEIDWVRAVKKS